MTVRSRRRHAIGVVTSVLVVGLLYVGIGPGASAHPGHDHVAVAAPLPELPNGFRDEVVLSSDLDQPTAGAQAADGRVLVLQKDGRLKMFDSFADQTSTTVLNLEVDVHNYIDRGALGMVLDPNFTANGFVYLMYTYNFRLGDDEQDDVPKWSGSLSPNYDDCATESTGCEVSNRIARYTIVGQQAVNETVLVTDWCQQYFSHSAGALEFGEEDGFLYASGGEGASYTDNENYDVGQFGNPCDDPPNAGGRLRAQDVRTLSSNDPTSLSGSVIRINPANGNPVPGNPLFNAPAAANDINARRMVAHGFRNPFRLAFQPGTNDLYVGDVGESTFEEINRVGVDRSLVANAGWPCFEGPNRYPDIARFPLCGGLQAGYAGAREPFIKYGHTEEVTFEEECAKNTGSVSGLAFAEDPGFPTGMRNGLVWGDYARDCIWYVPPGPNGVPDSANPKILVEHAGNPVDLFTGNDGALYYVDIGIGETFENIGGKIHRISFDDGRPVARINTVNDTNPWGLVDPDPLVVDFSAVGTSDPDDDPATLNYTWDGNGAVALDDTGDTARFQFDEVRDYVVTVTVSDGVNTDTASITVSAGNEPPDISIDNPVDVLKWGVGDQVPFSGTAIDPNEGELPATAIDWELTIEHGAGTARHSHPLQTAMNTDSGTVRTIDHELPSTIAIQMTATDGRGLATTVERIIQPFAVRVAYGTTPAGLRYSINGRPRTAPVPLRMIAGAQVQLSTPRRQYLAGRLWQFKSWPGNRPLSHTLTLPRKTEINYRATFVPVRRQLRVVTQPAGLKVGVLGGSRRSGYTAAVQVGRPVGITAPRTQVYRGFRYVFVRWSDRGARSHSFRMPADDALRRAVYRRAGRA